MEDTELIQSKVHLAGKQVTIFEEQELGRGTYGMVCKALYCELPCAAKLLSPILFKFSDMKSPDSSSATRFNQESKLLCAVMHPYIVQYFDAYIHSESRRPILLMELMDESLTNFLGRNPKTLPIHLQIKFCHNVIQALAYLHSSNITHRNLTGNNVLISAGSLAKVTDYGMMKLVDTQLESSPRFKQITTPDSIPYMPPEVFRHPPSYSHLLDIFSFGVLSLQILTRQYPQPSPSKVSEIERRESDFNSVEMDHVLLPIIKSCLKDRDILRPPAHQLCRKLNQLRDSRLYEDSRLKREQSLQEIDGTREELKRFQTKIEELESQLESVRIENTQLCRLITTQSENISSSLHQQHERFLGEAPQDYLDIHDPSLIDDDELENLMDLTCPHPALWYHGSIKRDIACMRLQAMAKPGAYLVRRSESEPGCYVLSFLDRGLRVFNYKISCRNGQYNASGQSKKWFSSLQNLIGYYTRYSTVKQNQHLDVPVAPPEIVPLPSL